MKLDHVPFVGIGALLTDITISQWNAIVGILVGLAGLGYVLTKWFVFYKQHSNVLKHPWRR